MTSNVPLCEVDAPVMLSAADRQPSAIASGLRRPVRIGYLGLAIVSGLFVLWAVLAPLDSAAIAPGLLRAEGGGRRVVQHLEGGMIRRLLVREGSSVKAGQPLVELDDTASSAQDAALQVTYDTLLAQDARLTAERSGAARVTYPAELLARRDAPRVAEILRASEQVFQAGRRGLAEQVAILSKREGQGRADLGGTGPQLAILDSQARSLGDEIAGVQTLVDEKLERRSRLLTLQRQQADVAAQRSRLLSNAARVDDVIGEARAQMALVRGQRITDAAKEQREVQASLAEAREKLSVSHDVDRRRLITAPVSGTVVNLRFVTPGGVLSSGQPLLDIVPSDADMVVVAHLKATDIDVVHPDLAAEIRLLPYKTRSVPMLIGRVRKVGADATLDEKSGELFYEVEIALDRHDRQRLQGVRLLSGMPAEVYIQLGTRSLAQYLVQPLIDSFRRAFRED